LRSKWGLKTLRTAPRSGSSASTHPSTMWHKRSKGIFRPPSSSPYVRKVISPAPRAIFVIHLRIRWAARAGNLPINDVSDWVYAEEAGRLLDFLHVFSQHAQWKRPQAFRAGQNDKRHPLGILSVPRYPDRSRLPVMVNHPCRRGLNQFCLSSRDVAPHDRLVATVSETPINLLAA